MVRCVPVSVTVLKRPINAIEIGVEHSHLLIPKCHAKRLPSLSSMSRETMRS